MRRGRWKERRVEGEKVGFICEVGLRWIWFFVFIVGSFGGVEIVFGVCLFCVF